MFLRQPGYPASGPVVLRPPVTRSLPFFGNKNVHGAFSVRNSIGTLKKNFNFFIYGTDIIKPYAITADCYIKKAVSSFLFFSYSITL